MTLERYVEIRELEESKLRGETRKPNSKKNNVYILLESS